MNMIQTKEDDLFLERGGNTGDEEDEVDEEEDYTVGSRGIANTTLRKSAAYSLGLFSKSFQEETF